MHMGRCNVCFRHCEIADGKTGFCGARTCEDGTVKALNYGRVSSIALDPVEKKPLARFFPGSYILSVGGFGCNLRCPFCQNNEISWSDEAFEEMRFAETVTPEELAEMAQRCVRKGNIGVAFTYNEPLVGYEFVRDTAKLVHEKGLKNALVTNGTAEIGILEEILPYIDAMNIDLKGFTDRYYEKVLGGSRRMVMDFIERAVKDCHVELTTLIVPGENDSEEEIREMSRWIAGLKDADGKVIGDEIPLHILRFFPRFHMTDRDATDVRTVYRLAEVARENLKYVYTGNC
ncbi:MAG: AmmeMemoRadiSam system radical SAM enzyme [Lachnospiraceae bacterium]|nr:AmmeMemoRadiSam system radical SAM enzyme [Lachnospiraceae bacterium]